MKGIIGVVHRAVGFPMVWSALYALHTPGRTRLVTVEGTHLAKQRNHVIQAAVEDGADWVLFVDDDHLFDPRSLERLLAWDVPIVGGLYCTRTEPYRTTAMRWAGDRGWVSLTADEVATGTLIPVDAIGMGFTLIRRCVWEAVPRPWFKVGQQAPTEMGEDVYLCRQAMQAGYQVYVDCGLRISHLVVMAVTPNLAGSVTLCAASLEAIRASGVELILDRHR